MARVQCLWMRRRARPNASLGEGVGPRGRVDPSVDNRGGSGAWRCYCPAGLEARPQNRVEQGVAAERQRAVGVGGWGWLLDLGAD